MPKVVVGPVDAFPPGSRQRVEVEGRGIAIFNAEGTLYALRDACPHQGAHLSAGTVHGFVAPSSPGCYDYVPERKLVRCPWHGWEYELATGKSWYDPAKTRVRSFPVAVEHGAELGAGGSQPGPFTAETFPITVEDDYVVVEV